MRILLLSLVFISTVSAQDKFKFSDAMNKAKEFTKENPNCTSAVIESLKKESTITCAKALKPGTKDKKRGSARQMRWFKDSA